MPSPQPAQARAITLVIALCGIAASLTQTMIVPLVPVLPTILRADAADASWALTITLLVGSVMTPIGGRFGDMFGKRRVLLVALAALTLGSATCALGEGLAPMLVGRALQGAAMMAIPLGISILRDELPHERVGGAIALVSASMGFGGALGLPLAAFIADRFDWHTLFWVATAVGAVGLFAVWRLVPESPVRTPSPIDVPGALGLAAGLVALLVAITKGDTWGWTSPTTLGLVAASAVIFAGWSRWELRIPAPMVDLRVSARRQVLVTNGVSVLMAFAMFAVSLIPMQIMMAPRSTGYGLGHDMLTAGLMMAPGGLAMLLASPVSARISALRGPRTSLALGCATILGGYLVFLLLREESWQIVLGSSLISAGVGFGYAAMPALIMGAVPVSETGAANGLNALMRSIGSSISSAAVAAVLASMTITVGGHAFPSSTGFDVAIWITIAASAGALALTFALPRHRGPQAEADAALTDL
ncbi:MFS transporter [Nocardioides sp. AE5]|uniref:MFS transporter n=1 Tax=Nocardioides sp. AE5 TaxID=2962573 RepID=UPI002881C9B1|nr:MFS transporter [Nocardioides sp. AE5]MDT0202570.1 MFS transporter [Nocardioides sp. AE5]